MNTKTLNYEYLIPHGIAPLWSPDGTWIAFQYPRSDGTDLFTIDLRNRTIQHLTYSYSNRFRGFNVIGLGFRDDRAYQWFPDNQHLLLFLTDGWRIIDNRLV